jgi:hypothetical protein
MNTPKSATEWCNELRERDSKLKLSDAINPTLIAEVFYPCGDCVPVYGFRLCVYGERFEFTDLVGTLVRLGSMRAVMDRLMIRD